MEKGGYMPKYLLQASYSVEGTQGLLKEGGSRRRSAIQQALQAVGGKLESMYYALGEHDVYLIIDVPDAVGVTAIAMVARASGALSGASTVQLLTVEEIDKAVKTAVRYRRPGQ